MKKVIHKVFLLWQFEKEEKWLTEMSEKGFRLVSVGWCKYVFEEAKPGEYAVKLELLENVPGHKDSVEYIKFIEETGAEYIGSVMRWVYFSKKKSDGDFDLFSDIDSRIKHLNRILLLVGILCVMELFLGIINLGIGITFNVVVGIFCILLGLLLGYGYLRIYLRKSKLKAERALHE